MRSPTGVSSSAAPCAVAHKAPLSVGFPRQEWSEPPFLSPGKLKAIKNKISHRVSSLTECCLTLNLGVRFLPQIWEVWGPLFLQINFLSPSLLEVPPYVGPLSMTHKYLGLSTLFFFPLCFSDWIISNDQFVDSSA